MKMQWVKVNCGAGGRNLGQFHGEPDYDLAQLRVGDYYKSSVDGNTYEWRMVADNKPHFDFSRTPNSGKSVNNDDWLTSVDGLPPVGTVCEWSRNAIAWEPCQIIHYYMNTVLIDHTIHRGNVRLFKLDDMKFRPIKSDRERAIDEILSIVDTVNVTNEQLAELIYDAGFRKEGE